MDITSNSDLFGLLLAIIILLNIGLFYYLYKKKIVSEKRAVIIYAISISFSISLLLYISIQGFPLFYSLIVFIVSFVFVISYYNSIMKLHKHLFRKK